MAQWAGALHALLREEGVTQVGVVPDAGHADLIRLCANDPGMRVVPLTTEEEGVALALGAWAGGAKCVLLMQSSGVGNCINMLSILTTCQAPLAMLVTMRGEHGEFNPWQVAMGQETPKVLEAMQVVVARADSAEDVVPHAAGMLRLAFNTLRPTALLIGQRAIGAKSFKN